jgi:hypothetical protein
VRISITSRKPWVVISAVLARLEERTGGHLWLAAALWSLATAICLRVFVFRDPNPQPEVVFTSAPAEDEEAAETGGHGCCGGASLRSCGEKHFD